MPKGVFRFWSDDRSLTVFLIFLLVYMFVFSTEARHAGILGVLSNIVLVFILLGGLFTMTHNAVLRISIAVFSVLFLIVHWPRLEGTGSALILIERSVTILFASALLAVVLSQVYRSGPVTGHRIRGAIAGYLLLVIIFSALYSVIDTVSPNSFKFAVPPEDVKTYIAQDFFYFSVITLTTLGYGDIIPVHPLARTMAMIEALTGQLYVAVLIARLVSSAVGEKKTGTEE